MRGISRRPRRASRHGRSRTVAPFAGATDVEAIRRRPPADPSGIENLAHNCLPSSWWPIRFGGAVLFLECRDGGCEVGRDLGAFATGQAAAQFGAEFVDVVLKRNHRPLLLFSKTGRAHRADRAGSRTPKGAAERGAEEPILSSAGDK